jgi:hypothetical protein
MMGAEFVDQGHRRMPRPVGARKAVHTICDDGGRGSMARGRPSRRMFLAERFGVDERPSGAGLTA